jgi:hypothetical protein
MGTAKLDWFIINEVSRNKLLPEKCKTERMFVGFVLKEE